MYPARSMASSPAPIGVGEGWAAARARLDLPGGFDHYSAIIKRAGRADEGNE